MTGVLACALFAPSERSIHYTMTFFRTVTRTAERPALSLFLFVMLGLCRLSDTDGVRARHGLL